MMRRKLVAAGLLMVGLMTSGCGYALAGRGNALPTYIRRIGVPQFINHSSVPDLDRVLSDAVRAEFQGRGRYVVQPDTAGSDAVLTTTITSVIRQPVDFTQQQATKYVLIVTAALEFKDLKEDKVIWANPSFVTRDEYDVSTSVNANDPAAQLGLDRNALERLSKGFARTVVMSIFEAF